MTKKSLAVTLLAGTIALTSVLPSVAMAAPGEKDLVPLRTAAEAQGAKVTWHQKNQTIVIERGADEIIVTVGEQQAEVNGKVTSLEGEPVVQAGKTYISLSTLNTLLSSQAEWNETEQTIHFASNDTAGNASLFVHKLFSGNASQITSLMSESLKASMPADEIWTAIGQQYALIAGKPIMLQDAVVERNGVHTNVSMTYETTQIPLSITVRFDGNGYVDDLYIDAAVGNVPYVQPDYDKGNYSEEEVVIGEGSFAVPGTLTVPEGEGPFPVVVLVHGSGPHDRDSSISGTKVFKDIAAGLAAKNIAVLRYEKVTREHTFKVSAQPLFTLKNESADDANRAIELLQQREDIDKDRIFVAGHSQGGFAMPLILSNDTQDHIAGAILLSAPSSTYMDAMLEQQEVVIGKMKELGLPSEMIAAQEQTEAMVQQIAVLLEDPAYSKDNMPQAFPMSPAYWWYEQRDYVPAEAMKDVEKPLLIMQGENDWQVTMKQFEGWKTALEGHEQVTFTSYPNMNHLLTEYEGISIGLEYATPANVSSKLITDLADWILKFTE